MTFQNLVQLQEVPLRIGIPTWSWKRRLGVFVGVFGGVWLFVDPFTVFAQNTLVLPVWVYLCLLGVAGISAFLIERLSVKRSIGKITFVDFTVVLTKTGMRVPVSAPQDMQVGVFVKLLLEDIGNRIPYREHRLLPLYDLNLAVKHQEQYEVVSNELTLQEADLTTGATCKLRGYIRIEYLIFYASGYESELSREVREAVKEGRIFLDEDIAIPVENLSLDRRSRASGIATLFVIDNEAEHLSDRNLYWNVTLVTNSLLDRGWETYEPTTEKQ